MGELLEVRGRVKEIKGRKVVVASTISARGQVCVQGEVVAIRMPETMQPGKTPR